MFFLAGTKIQYSISNFTPDTNIPDTYFVWDTKAHTGVEVVDLRTLAPLDRETVCASARKTSKVLLLHEDTRTGGMAGELAATITESVFEYLDGPIVRVTAPDTPVPFSSTLEEAFLPNAGNVIAKARWLYRY